MNLQFLTKVDKSSLLISSQSKSSFAGWNHNRPKSKIKFSFNVNLGPRPECGPYTFTSEKPRGFFCTKARIGPYVEYYLTVMLTFFFLWRHSRKKEVAVCLSKVPFLPWALLLLLSSKTLFSVIARWPSRSLSQRGTSGTGKEWSWGNCPWNK